MIVSSTPASVSLTGLALSTITPTTADTIAPIAIPPSTPTAPPLGIYGK